MDIEKKIRKLLALSESPNEFEAQAAQNRNGYSLHDMPAQFNEILED